MSFMSIFLFWARPRARRPARASSEAGSWDADSPKKEAHRHRFVQPLQVRPSWCDRSQGEHHGRSGRELRIQGGSIRRRHPRHIRATGTRTIAFHVLDETLSCSLAAIEEKGSTCRGRIQPHSNQNLEIDEVESRR